MTKSRDAEELEAHLQDLSARLNRLGYQPQPTRRIGIPKPGSETGRPLGRSRIEDTRVARATKRGHEPLCEPLLEDGRDGYPPSVVSPRALTPWGEPCNKSVSTSS